MVAALAPVAVLADAIPLSFASSKIEAWCGGGGIVDNKTVVPFGATIECDQAYLWPGGELDQESGFAATTFGLAPTAHVLGAAWVSGGPGSGAAFMGYATVDYFVALGESSTPPEVVTSIPVTLNWSGEASFEGAGWANSWVDFGTTEYVTPGVVNLLFAPGIDYHGTVGSDCYAWVGSGLDYSECQAVTDPIFQFDQAAFDAQMGTLTFPLANYYAFELSPNLVPEPSPAMTTGLALAILCVIALSRKATLVGTSTGKP
jgi:hypothetical protein